MPTKFEIEKQVELERDAIAQGLKKLRDNTRRLEEKEYASATVYGVASIDTLLPLVIQEIEDSASYRLDRGNKDITFQRIRVKLKDLEPLAAAAIACKVLFDRVFAKSTDHNKLPNALVDVSAGIGKAIEDEMQMRHYEHHAPGLLHIIKEKYWHKSAGTQQRVTVTQTILNRYPDIPKWERWGQENRVKIGGWLIHCLMKASGWFTLTKVKRGKETPNVIIPTPEFVKIKDTVVANSELFSPEAWPMLVSLMTGPMLTLVDIF